MASPPTSVPPHQSPLRSHPNPTVFPPPPDPYPTVSSLPPPHPNPTVSPPPPPPHPIPTVSFLPPPHLATTTPPRPPPRRPIHKSERINNFQSALDKQLEPKYFASLKIYTVDVESGDLNNKKKVREGRRTEARLIMDVAVAIRQRFELLIGTPGSVNVGRRREKEEGKERKRREERSGGKGKRKEEYAVKEEEMEARWERARRDLENSSDYYDYTRTHFNH
ncbi:hypothetical protein Pcinc_036886 [Petrolisthes cinctipes]|uniref:Uncharacterized protein n=1 Tax=Petrolisthes cinctipes TaxID=88211 RepID=A0AAE1BV74_PETCI|nr:hypothetical protein Pcinc_036886 [Petrolisthes cinctipes]